MLLQETLQVSLWSWKTAVKTNACTHMHVQIYCEA